MAIEELREIYEKDPRHRLETGTVAKKYGHQSDEVKALWAKQEVLDKANLTRIEAILATHGNAFSTGKN